jgi:hypothetical protein
VRSANQYRVREFVEVVEKVFQAFATDQAFEIESRIAGNDNSGADIIFSREGVQVVVEIKVFATNYVSRQKLLGAITQTDTYRRLSDSRFGALVVNTVISNAQIEEYARYFPEVVILDYRHIRAIVDELSWRDPEETFPLGSPPFSSPVLDESVDISMPLKKLGIVFPLQHRYRSTPTEGVVDCATIENIPKGKSGARAYEEILTTILKDLFNDNLSDWKSQARSDSGMNVNDLVARISGGHDFWESIKNHFNSLYVVFEFKNYSKPIPQGQIYTTERYLFRNALRSVAFLISRDGLSTNGKKAASGALREHGKVIVSICDQQVCEMLRLHADGDDPTIVLAEALNTFLIEIER